MVKERKTILEMISEQEKMMTELIRENAQLKKDGLVLESILSENSKLRKELNARTISPITDADWNAKFAAIQSKYKGKAIQEGKLRKKVEKLKAQLEEAQNTPSQEITDGQTVKPKICIIRADYPVFRDLDEAYERIESLLRENEAYRDHSSKLELENSQLKAEIEERDASISNFEKDISSYEDLLNETNTALAVSHYEIDDLKRQIQVLQGKLQSKEIMYNSYKEQNGCTILVEGVEEDLYPGEQRDIVLSYIKDHMSNLDKNTRQYHVCKSIIEANPENGTRAELRRKMYEKLRNLTKIDENTPNMPELGLTFHKEGTKNHCKVVFMNNSRYTTSIAGTPSDGNRSGLNSARQFCNLFL